MNSKETINLSAQRCVPCEGGVEPLSEEQIRTKLDMLEGWSYENGIIRKMYKFRNYYQTIAFVNAIAWFTHLENHHPDLHVTYNTCTVAYSTHAVNGITDNDFICAVKVDALLDSLQNT